MRLPSNRIWLLAFIAIGVLILLNRIGVQKLHEVDVQSISDRAEIHARLDSLDDRVTRLEAEGRWQP